MDMFKIISQMLGIQDVYIKDIKIYQKTHTIIFQVEHKPEKRICRNCGNSIRGIHDWQEKLIEAPSMGIFSKVSINVKYARGGCRRCEKICSPRIEWIHPEISSMSCGLAEIAGRMMEEITCEATGRLLRINPRKLWDLDQYRMQTMMQMMKLPEDINLKDLSADEVHFKTLHRRVEKGILTQDSEVLFTTNLVSYNDSKVIFNSEGRGANSLSNCLKVLSSEQKNSVERISVDMHEPYISAIKKELPKAKINIDRFHLAQQVNRCFDEVRKSELKVAKDNADQFLESMLMPSRRFILIERKQNKTKQEIKMLEKLRGLNKNIHSAMLIVEFFHNLLDRPKVESFRISLKNWYFLVRQSGLKPFEKFAYLIKKYRRYIETYISSGLSSAVSEGLNNKIKTLKRMAYGYSNSFSFRLKILQRCGYLNHYYINTDEFLYRMPHHK